MNERIKELAEEAGFEFWQDEAWRPEGQLIDWSSDYDNELKKFAELILQECLVLFENAKVNQEDDVDYGLEEAKNIIKEHFGVEE